MIVPFLCGLVVGAIAPAVVVLIIGRRRIHSLMQDIEARTPSEALEAASPRSRLRVIQCAGPDGSGPCILVHEFHVDELPALLRDWAELDLPLPDCELLPGASLRIELLSGELFAAQVFVVRAWSRGVPR